MDRLFVRIISGEGSENTEPSLEGLAASTIRTILKKPGLTDPKSSSADITISGLPAKRISISAKGDGKDIYSELLCLVKGQHLWIVDTVFQDASKTPAVKAMLDSVRIK